MHPERTFVDHATGTIALCNMGALYNIKSALCDIKSALSEIGSALRSIRWYTM